MNINFSRIARINDNNSAKRLSTYGAQECFKTTSAKREVKTKNLRNLTSFTPCRADKACAAS